MAYRSVLRAGVQYYVPSGLPVPREQASDAALVAVPPADPAARFVRGWEDVPIPLPPEPSAPPQEAPVVDAPVPDSGSLMVRPTAALSRRERRKEQH